MTVDPATTPHRHDHHGQSYFFCSGGCRTKFAADPAKYLDPSAREPRGADAGRHDLHLPDASGGPAGRPGLLPDLRHGAGTGDADAPTPAQSRTDRHDAAVLDRACADRAGRRAGDGRAPVRLASADRRRCRTGCSSLLATPVVLWAGWPFFVRGGQSLVTPQPQHVHADRARHRRGVDLQRRRDARARPVPAGVPRA